MIKLSSCLIWVGREAFQVKIWANLELQVKDKHCPQLSLQRGTAQMVRDNVKCHK